MRVQLLSSVEEGGRKLLTAIARTVKDTVCAGNEAGVLYLTLGAYVYGKIGSLLAYRTDHRYFSEESVQKIQEPDGDIAYPYKRGNAQKDGCKQDAEDDVYYDPSCGDYKENYKIRDERKEIGEDSFHRSRVKGACPSADEGSSYLSVSLVKKEAFLCGLFFHT